MSDRNWYPRKPPGRWRYVVARIEYANWAGTWYEHAKDVVGRTLRFWTSARAQAHADATNAALAPQEQRHG